ncbi:MAG: hypothetical protein ACP5KG_02665 [Myxococcota bacterium]
MKKSILLCLFAILLLDACSSENGGSTDISGDTSSDAINLDVKQYDTMPYPEDIVISEDRGITDEIYDISGEDSKDVWGEDYENEDNEWLDDGGTDIDREDAGDIDVDTGGSENIKIMTIGDENNEEGTAAFYYNSEIFITGTSYYQDYNSSDLFIARVNEKTLKSKLDYMEFDIGLGISVVDGIIYVGGYTGSSGSFKGLFALFNQYLEPIEQHTYTEDNKGVQFFAMKNISNYTFALAGFVTGSDNDAAIYIVDDAGNIKNKVVFNKNMDQEFYSIDVDEYGNIAAAGIDVVDNVNFVDVYTVKLDKDLNILWEKRLGSKELDGAYNVKILRDGSVLVAGYTEKDKNISRRDGYLILYDKDGNLVWDKRYGSSNDDEIKVVYEDENGDIIAVMISNIYDPFSSTGDVVLLKIDRDGEIVNSEFLTSDAIINDIVKIDNDYLLIGTYYDPPPGQGDSDVLLIKVSNF